MKSTAHTIVIAAALILCASILYAETNPYPIEYQGSTLWSRPAQKAVQGDYAYLGMRYGIMIVDISDPAIPSIVSTLEFPDLTQAEAIGVSGNHLYAVSRGDTSFNSIDVSDPSNPSIVGSCKMRSHTHNMIISGQYAVVTEYDGGVEFVDISVPDSPAVATHIQTDKACEVVLVDDLLFVADYEDIEIIDISNLSEPSVLAVYESVGKAQRVAIDGSYLYVADSDFGLRILDISVPTSPTLVRDYEIEYCGDVLIIDHFAYVSGGSDGIQMYDIADPANPVFQGAIVSEGWSLLEVDGYLYVQESWSRLEIFDVSTPPAYSLAGTFEPASSSAKSAAVYGDYVYVCAGNVFTIDCSDPTNPVVIHEYDTQGQYGAQMARISGDHLFVVDGTGLEALDLSDPEEPVYAGRLNVDVSFISIDGDYAAVSNSNTVYLVNISNPGSMSIEGTYSGSPFFRDAVLSGNYLYLSINYSSSSAELHIIDVSDPVSPQLMTIYSTTRSSFSAIEAAGDYLYLHAGYGLEIVDVSNPALPTEVSYISTSSITEIVANGDFLYTSTIGNGLDIVDVFLPQLPQKIASYRTSGNGYGIALSGDYVYLADEYGLLMFHAPAPELVLGDSDGSGEIDIDDIVFLIDFIFVGGPLPLPVRTGDADSSGLIDIDDVVFLIEYVFGG